MEPYSLNPSFFTLTLDGYSVPPSDARKEFLNKIDHSPEITYIDVPLSSAKESLARAQIATSLEIAFEIDPTLEEVLKNTDQLKIIVTNDIKETFTKITGLDSSLLQQSACALTLSRRPNSQKDTVLISLRMLNAEAAPDSPDVMTISSVAHELFHLGLPLGIDEQQEELITTEKTISFLENLADKHPELLEDCMKSIEQEKKYRRRFL